MVFEKDAVAVESILGDIAKQIEDSEGRVQMVG